ncbi:MAG TPA: BtpA/SgcQ family protein [Chthoniobacterales bacterium]|jgi:membrane complex biogenesis BtpA family protein
MNRSLFGKRCAVIGMVHLPGLPGTPHHRLSLPDIVAVARREAADLAGAGVDALLIENMHDRPYCRGGVGPEIVAAMTAAACAVKREVSLPCGVQVLAAANEAALAVALGAELDFIRAEGFVFAHVADEGVIEGCAASLLRARKAWGAEHIKLFTDIKKKHSSHAITADVSIAETAHAAEFFCSDGVIVTGAATGDPVSIDELASVAGATELPVLVGSGATTEGAAALFPHANALIVGSYFKRGGRWDAPIDLRRVREFVRHIAFLRGG